MLAFAAYSCHAGWEAKMRSQEIAAGFLRAVGLLLIVIGLVHLAATPHVPPLVCKKFVISLSALWETQAFLAG